MKKFYENFNKVEEFVCCMGFLLMIALVFLSAIMRTSGHPLAWSIDVAQIMLCWTTLIGADIAYRHKKFLGLDLITRKLPTKVQIGIKIIMDLLIICSLGILFYYGIGLSISNWKRQFQTLTISYSAVTLALPVMSFLMVITVCLEVKELLTKLKKEVTK